MAFPTWRKQLGSLLSSVERLWGRSAKVMVGAALAATGVPQGDATTPVRS